jgi:antitoxin (DNA-binding transcriptional repressor) of toxin-antitoxin stability system
MKVSAQYAEEHLTDILNAADSGAEVEIARPDQPTYRLTLVKSEPTKPKSPRILGAGRGDRVGRKQLLGAGEDLITLPTDEEWAAMDKEIEDLMLNNPLFPDEK